MKYIPLTPNCLDLAALEDFWMTKLCPSVKIYPVPTLEGIHCHNQCSHGWKWTPGRRRLTASGVGPEIKGPSRVKRLVREVKIKTCCKACSEQQYALSCDMGTLSPPNYASSNPPWNIGGKPYVRLCLYIGCYLLLRDGLNWAGNQLSSASSLQISPWFKWSFKWLLIWGQINECFTKLLW